MVRNRLGWWVGLMAGVSLAACAGRGMGAPTPTPIVIVAGTSLLATAEAASATPVAPAEIASVEATPIPAASDTAAPTATPDPVTEALADPLLRTYRVMVSMQVNATLLAETAALVEAGQLEEDDTAVAALALGALTQSVDEDAPQVTPPPELDGAWQSAVAAHETIKAAAGQWLLGPADAGSLSESLAPSLADLEAALVQADGAVATAYGVDAAELTEYRQRIATTVKRLYEE